MAGSRKQGAMPLFGEQRRKMLQEAVDMFAETGNKCEAARRLGIPHVTFYDRLRVAAREGVFHNVKPKAGEFNIPPGIDLSPRAVKIEGAYKILFLSDTHAPYHDMRAIETAVNDGIKHGATLIYFNGDIIDCAAASRHARLPKERLDGQEEIDRAHQLLKAICNAFPSARKIYRPGNHERRVPHYLMSHCEAYAGLRVLEIQNLLGLSGLGIEWIEDQTQLSFGSLHVRHGDEWRIGAGVVSPAKIALDRAKKNVAIGNFHRTSEHLGKDIEGDVAGGWSVGCLCQLRPAYMPENNWNHGHALIELDGIGFEFLNRKIIKGKVY